MAAHNCMSADVVLGLQGLKQGVWGGTLYKVQWLRNVLAVKLHCLGKTLGQTDISVTDTSPVGSAGANERT